MQQFLQMSQNPNNRLFIEYLTNIKDNKDTLYNYYINAEALKNSLNSFPEVKYSDAFEILHSFIFKQVITAEQRILFENLFLSPHEKLEQYFKDISQVRTEFAINLSDEEILKILNLINVINHRIQNLWLYLNLRKNELPNYSSNPNKLDELVEKFSLIKITIIKVINMILEKSNSYPNFNFFMNQSPQPQNNLYNPNQNLYSPQYQNFNPSFYPQQQNFSMNQPPFFNPEFNNPNPNPPFMHQTILQYPTSPNSYFPQNQNFNPYISQPQSQYINNPNNPNQYTYYPPSQNNWGSQNYNQYQNPNLPYMNQSSNYSQNNFHGFSPTIQLPFSAPNISHSQNPTSTKNDSNPFINPIFSTILATKRKFENDIKSLKSNMESIKNSNNLSEIADALNSSEQQLKSYINSILDILNKKEHNDNTQTKLNVIIEIYKKSNLNVKDINSIVTSFINLSEIYPIKNEVEKQINEDVKLLKETLELIKNSKFLQAIAETLELSIETLISYMDYIINIFDQENIQNLNEAVENLNIEDFDSIILFIIALLEKYPLDEMPKETKEKTIMQTLMILKKTIAMKMKLNLKS